jgi:flagellar assembly protein FliH
MSLFKIIKAAAPVAHGVEAFDYASFQLGDQPLFCALPDNDDFQPIYATAPFLMADEVREPAAETPLLPAETVPAGPSPEEVALREQDAYDKGFAEGRRQVEESFAGIFRTFSETVDALNGLRGRIVCESRDDILNLAMMVAKQIIHREVAQDRTILSRFVAEAVKGVTEQEDIVICLNPEDCRIVSANRHLYLEGIDEQQVSIKPDESVPVGGCIVDTPTGMVDARLETQLAEIYRHLVMEGANFHEEENAFPEDEKLPAYGPGEE